MGIREKMSPLGIDPDRMGIDTAEVARGEVQRKKMTAKMNPLMGQESIGPAKKEVVESGREGDETKRRLEAVPLGGFSPEARRAGVQGVAREAVLKSVGRMRGVGKDMKPRLEKAGSYVALAAEMGKAFGREGIKGLYRRSLEALLDRCNAGDKKAIRAYETYNAEQRRLYQGRNKKLAGLERRVEHARLMQALRRRESEDARIIKIVAKEPRLRGVAYRRVSERPGLLEILKSQQAAA